VFVVPAIVSGLVAAQQQDRSSPRVEGIQDAMGSSFVLNSQFTHVAVPRRRDA
jgi:hypothetical protein